MVIVSKQRDLGVEIPASTLGAEADAATVEVPPPGGGKDGDEEENDLVESHCSNRGPADDEIVLVSKINDSIKQVNGHRVSFRVIVNQIMDQSVYDMFQDHLAKDNCVSFFGSLDLPGFSFDIKIDGVMLLRFDKEAVMKNKYRE
ncbi:hypothetical protein BG006_000966 [Podila minutissima]|uniref:Uncharacterized protein n=1 Tax=Podila minutissima TaxID=64525 RepID=A0A9P5SAR2_9FUNG|nr:hypothetical protein BG006_000966 [Podila minutissima]